MNDLQKAVQEVLSALTRALESGVDRDVLMTHVIDVVAEFPPKGSTRQNNAG
jgi:hypothetical protein